MRDPDYQINNIDLLTDARLFNLSRSTQFTWIQCIALATECEAGGLLIDADGNLTPEYIAWRFHLTTDELMTDLKMLIRSDLIVETEEESFVTYSVPPQYLEKK